MRIKKLDIVGFKSFKDRTVIQFDEGITGIVGPNGCGKSNIVDALVWVMGEMSAKHLRGSSMSDVIFAGADGYAPMGMAEVTLTLENEGGPFPARYARFSEVMVTRRLHRNGESEYLINKEPARLRDIQEVFMDTGAGSKGFSIIEQGAIGKIITAKPVDRRVLIEEAAGITKFKVRKRESQRKLISTDQNLVRLQDILSEQKRQLDSLERQAQRAERYRKLKTELQDKDLWLASQQYLELHEKTTDAEKISLESRDEEATVSSKMNQLELEVNAMKLEVSEHELKINDKAIEHQSLTRSVQESEFRIRELNTAIEQGRKAGERTGSLLEQQKHRKESIETQLQETDEQLIDVRESSVESEAKFQSLNSEFETVQQNIQNYDRELTEKRRDMLSVSAALSHVEAREQSLTTKVNEKSAELNESEENLKLLAQQKVEFEERRNRLYKELESQRQLQFDSERDLENINANLQSLRDQKNKRASEYETIKDDLNKVASRLYGLENLQANFEGFEEGVKNIMLWQKARHEQSGDNASSFKPLADVVEVQSQYELAMEASMGHRLQTLLAPSSDEAVGAVGYLKSNNNGRSSFASGDMMLVENAPEVVTELRTEAGIEGLLEDVVQIPEALRGQVAHFFKGIAIVDSIRTALSLRPRYLGYSFVTLDGDMLSADGVITGGSEDSADTGVLRRRREMKELSFKRDELSGKVQLAQLNLKKIEEQAVGIEASLENAKRDLVQKEIAIAQLMKDFERSEQELSNAVKSVEKSEREHNLKVEAIESLKTQLESHLTEIQELGSRKLELESRVEVLTQDLETAKNGVSEKAQLVNDLRVKSAEQKQRLESLERQRAYLQDTLNNLSSDVDQMSDEVEKTNIELTDNQRLITELQNELTVLVHKVQESEKELSEFKNTYQLQENVLNENESSLSEMRGRVNQLRNNLNEATLKLEQYKMREENLCNQMQERYGVSLSEFAPSQKDVAGDRQIIEAEVNELKDKVKRIGEVNLAAINEYDELVERYNFLSKQYADLEEAKNHLRKVIDRINRICSRKFRDTFEQVNERFKQVFPVLFGGGEAALILIENPEEDEPGIDIMAKPPGKKLQNVSLLSGGEKALTAVSLIFSIFLVKPSPFCLLDEVDAPLDDANVLRFNDLVREMARRSQIIVVTHNKHTMKVNNKLYGVTMQEKGVSKMVSVSLADAARLAEA